MATSEGALPERRMRTLSPKAFEHYQEKLNDYRRSIEQCWDDICDQIKDIPFLERNYEGLKDFLYKLSQRCEKYKLLCKDLTEFLETTHTEHSLQQKELLANNVCANDNVIQEKFSILHAIIQDIKKNQPVLTDQLSVKSVGSRKSNSPRTASIASSTSSATKSRAKAEKLKAQLQYLQREAELKKQRAAIEVDLEVLSAEKEAAATEAEADALDGSYVLSNSQRGSVASLPTEQSAARTERYISDLLNNEVQDSKVKTLVDHDHTGLNPTAQTFVPLYQPERSYPVVPPPPVTATEITKLLLKKDLLFASLTPFNDMPETYQSWKYSFKSKMSELSVTALEEMDLLTKWAGPGSKEQVINMRSAYFSDPSQGIQEIWARLDERYGAPESIEASLKKKLELLPRLSNKDTKKLYELSDILLEIKAVKSDPRYSSLLAYFDSSTGVTPVVNKLPHYLQEKWTMAAHRYMERNNVSYPPFVHFCEFIREQSKIRNNPSFQYAASPNSTVNVSTQNQRDPKQKVHTRKTSSTLNEPSETSDKIIRDITEFCPLHNMTHSFLKCKKFSSKPIDVRRKFLQERNLCFRCCSPAHQRHNCKTVVKCEECDSDKHVTIMHYNAHNQNVKTACTQVCGGKFRGRSCAKVVPVMVYHKDNPGHAIKTYALIDDQSNKTLASSTFFDNFAGACEFPEIQYSLSSCSGVSDTSGRRAEGFIIQSVDATAKHDLPVITECNQIPDEKEEIPTPDVAYNHPHLRDIASAIQEFDSNCLITLLIGRDLVEAHHVHDQRIGPKGAPYAQKLSLGWVIIGETCLGRVHRPDSNVSVYKTRILSDGRPSSLPPCCNAFTLRLEPMRASGRKEPYDLFEKGPDSEKLGMSIEGGLFMKLMESEFKRDAEGNLTAPLPFRSPRQRLPNNRGQALKRAKILHASLERNPVKKDHFTTFMEGIIKNGHAEVAGTLDPQAECWYLPLFGVYHPKKKDKIRGVFDSSAVYEGVSLNNVLLKGPDLTNSLIGVLMRFRQGAVAISGDIESMFYCFSVLKDHQDFLRFFWYKDNDPSKQLIEYRMRKHVFGNRPSPAVANFGLRKVVEDASDDIREFVQRNFYVDDGLTSCDDVDSAVSLMKRTQQTLSANGKIRLHKIASNNQEVLDAFNSEDIAKDISGIDIQQEQIPLQRSLGIQWDLRNDSFPFLIDFEDKPYTRRGVLATINSLYDPLGFAAPVTIKGKVLLRNMMSSTTDWDEALSTDFKSDWEMWQRSLRDLESVKIPRAYNVIRKEEVVERGFHVFCDASENAVAAVAYLRVKNSENNIHVGFVLGKTRVAPKQGHTIPRLELCAASLAIEVAEIVSQELDIPPKSITYYTDSKVVLGYLNNKTRRFYVYVTNRVERILKFSEPHQWHYVRTSDNPADHGTRFVPSALLADCSWIMGPELLFSNLLERENSIQFDLIDPQQDKEVRPEQICTKKSSLVDVPRQKTWLTAEKIERFSSLSSIVRAISFLQNFAAGSQSNSTNNKHAETLIIRQVQKDIYGKDLECLVKGRPLNRGSSLLSLSPVLNKDNLLCVGGRLKRADIPVQMKSPILIPGKHHLATLLVRHYHEKVCHQGRHLTEGAVREAGYWITGGKRLISSIIHSCVTCRKSRGKLGVQKMSDLPTERLEPGPPFTSVGVDCFGPWQIVTRKTRGGQANSKRWAVLFTCLTSRAVHIEVIEEMSTSSFINALRRFISIRGKVKIFRSDRGTNFVGSMEKLGGINVENDAVRKFLLEDGCKWIFNPPHASHMGGVWERMIGVARRILDALLLDSRRGVLTHEVLTTFLAEVTAIVNSRPLVPLSSDPQDPYPLSPSLILTHKSDSITDIVITADIRNMYRAQWKMVQCLSDMFWKKWRMEFLQSLQERRKWNKDQRNIRVSDVVLLRDKMCARNYWPMGIITEVFPSEDGKIRTAEVRVMSPKGTPSNYTRPISELVLLLETDNE
ncbi:uncharacterized protein LOC117316337 [Pecten maximus]|uniref:uncharacterized protein LOC117316337 n=1 Tax=Pecten maximus TaxID=6579 RepID=UPI001458EF11|nr:uncharacterized protein LOC117316337 [Pecten maximus]